MLEELIALRVEAFGEIVKRMSQSERAALIRGTQAFTIAYRELSDAGS